MKHNDVQREVLLFCFTL